MSTIGLTPEETFDLLLFSKVLTINIVIKSYYDLHFDIVTIYKGPTLCQALCEVLRTFL